MKFALRADIIRRAWPPYGGWKYVEKLTGWTAPTPMTDNFDSTVDKILKHRAANRGYNLSLSRQDIAEDLMHQTAMRILKDTPEHADKWVVPIDEEAKKKSLSQTYSPPHQVSAVGPAGQSVVERLLNRVRNIARGVSTLSDWLGDGAVPVSSLVADRRAAICVGCPMNRPAGDFVDVITANVQSVIESQTLVKNAVGAVTNAEDKLGFCDACGCPLRLKVWVPVETIRDRTDESTMNSFHPACWIRNEQKTGLSAGIPRPKTVKTITIQRKAAFGDVILSTIVASKVRETGVGVRFITEPVIAQALHGHPDVESWGTSGTADVVLDRTYEDNLERREKDIGLLLLEAAEDQLRKVGVILPDKLNRVPVLGISDEERLDAAKALEGLPRPWIVMVDGSASWPNRTWKRSHVDAFPSVLGGFGSVIWSKPRGWSHAPPGVSGIDVRSFRHLIALISQADIVVSPDTGPIHIAAAFNKPVVALEQCNDTRLRLTNLTDWSAVSPTNLDCLRCNQFTCHIDAKSPPCQDIDPNVVASVVKSKWGAYTGAGVSAIIPVLNRSDRLDRCVEAIRSQVNEVIVVLDGKGSVSERVRGMGVKIVESTGARIGYGKSNMRAARQSGGRFLLLLNDDCYMDPGSVQKMVSVMGPTVGAVGALLRYPNGTIQHGGQFRPPGVIGFGHIDHGKRFGGFTEPTDMESVTFASALVRREAFFGVRGFDERYDCYSEDTDVCLKLGHAGWRIVYQPKATGIHDESQSTGPTKMAMIDAANAIFTAKWRNYLSNRKPLIS